jgi:hypothetical protein
MNVRVPIEEQQRRNPWRGRTKADPEVVSTLTHENMRSYSEAW